MIDSGKSPLMWSNFVGKLTAPARKSGQASDPSPNSVRLIDDSSHTEYSIHLSDRDRASYDSGIVACKV